MRCVACAKGNVIEIRMSVNGAEVTFRRCARCESQTWETHERPLQLTEVLDLARSA
jgi:hypothetical protein